MRTPRSVLVVVTRQIGDVLLTTPLLRRARELWPDARIDVLGFPGTLDVLRGNPDVSELVRMAPGSGWKALRALARRVWRRYDLALVAEISDRAHLAGWLAAPVRAGLLPPDGEGSRIKRALLRHAVQSTGDRGERHVVEEKLLLLAPWEPPGAHAGAQVQPPAPAALPQPLEAALAGRGYVVVHAPSMWTYKQWPLPYFSRLVELLCGDGHQVVLTGGPDAQDRRIVAQLQAEHAQRDVLDAGVLSFNQLAALLAGARLYVGPDTSVSHLAASTGVPVVAVFGPTNPQRWAPWPSAGGQPVKFVRSARVQRAGNVTLLQSDLACVPCGRAGCDDHRDSRSECLQQITPEAVFAQVRAVLAPAPAP